MILRKSLLFLLINLLSVSLFSIEIADKKQGKVTLDTKILMGTHFDSSELNWEFETPGVVVDLEGKFNERWQFDVSLDVGEAAGDDVSQLLQEAYITFDTTMNSRLKAGQLSIPFGEEETLGRYGRYHLSHSLGSKRISPGLDRGVIFSLRNIADIFDFDFGIFNGLGTIYEDITLNNVLVSSRQSVQFKPTIWLDVEGGYAAAFEIKESALLNADFSHTAYAKVEYDLGLEKYLFFLIEYMETHKIVNTLNSINGWELDFFTSAGFSYEKWDFFASFDYYRLNSKFNMAEDLWAIGSGVNLKPSENLKFTLFYKGDNYYNMGDFIHKAGLNAYFRL